MSFKIIVGTEKTVENELNKISKFHRIEVKGFQINTETSIPVFHVIVQVF